MAKVTVAMLLAQVAVLEGALAERTEQLNASESRRRFEGASYRATIEDMRLAMSPKRFVLSDIMAKCKELNMSGTACYVRGGKIFANRTNEEIIL